MENSENRRKNAVHGKIAVIFGGNSSEREISLRSGNGVLQALRAQGLDAHAFDPAAQALQELVTQKFSSAFIMMHGRHGEDGTLQGALELLSIPYTGSGVLASALAMDKIMAKRVWRAQGLSLPREVVLTPTTDLAVAARALGLPLIVKPAREGSTLGLSKVTDVAQMSAAYAKAARYDPEVLAEEFIEGREVTVALLEDAQGVRSLPVVEIIAPQGNYDFQNKYFGDAVRYECPAQLSPELTAQIQQLALAAYKGLGCAGCARADVMIRARDQQPFLLEINTTPGMTDHSSVPKAARAAGLEYGPLCVQILQAASLKLALPQV